MLLCAYAKLGLYAVSSLSFSLCPLNRQGVSSGFPTVLRFIWLQDCRKGICSCKVGPKKPRGRVWNLAEKIEVRQLKGPTGPVFFGDGTWSSMIILNLGVSFHGKLDDFRWILEAKASSSRVLGETYSSGCRLQLRTEQWKDCFVQGMDSCILAAWHGRPEGLVGLGLLGSSGYLHLRENGWGGSRSVSK